MATLITLFEVAPDRDEPFLAAWREQGHGTLHRALRRDVDFRFAAIAHDAEAPAGLPFPSHPGAYEVVHEDGRPDIAGGVILIDAFEVPGDADEPFAAGWQRARARFERQRGYLGTRLHRSAGPAEFRFVTVARWSSPLMFARALALPEVREAAELPFPSHPALYLVAGD